MRGRNEQGSGDAWDAQGSGRPSGLGGRHARVVEAVCAWYALHRRDLPWRVPDRTPWGVLVSEVMLQQTPVARVVPAWQAWLARWPDPPSLAADEPGEAVRMWGNLGYPRRALNLHATAVLVTREHGGIVPEDPEQLRALPGVGEYTTAALRAFAFGRRAVVLDTNIRRVLARVEAGQEHPPPTLAGPERARADAFVPGGDEQAATWSVAVMELGALVCTAANPRCVECPIAAECAWVSAGKPPYDGPVRRVQRFAGTDRQARGRLMAVVRGSLGPVERPALEAAWGDAPQRERALDGLVADGLVEPMPDGSYRLPVAPPVR